MAHLELWKDDMDIELYKSVCSALEDWIVNGVKNDIQSGLFEHNLSGFVNSVRSILNHIDRGESEWIKHLNYKEFDCLGETIDEIRYNVEKLDPGKLYGPGNVNIMLIKRLLNRPFRVSKYYNDDDYKKFVDEEYML